MNPVPLNHPQATYTCYPYISTLTKKQCNFTTILQNLFNPDHHWNNGTFFDTNIVVLPRNESAAILTHLRTLILPLKLGQSFTYQHKNSDFRPIYNKCAYLGITLDTKYSCNSNKETLQCVIT